MYGKQISVPGNISGSGRFSLFLHGFVKAACTEYSSIAYLTLCTNAYVQKIVIGVAQCQQSNTKCVFLIQIH